MKFQDWLRDTKKNAPRNSEEDELAIQRALKLIEPLALTSYDMSEINRRTSWYPERTVAEITTAWISTSKWFKQNGFHIAMTGGNCTAYGISIDENYHLLVTDDDGVDEPIFQDHLIFVGCYDADGNDYGCETMLLSDFMEVWND